MKKRVMEARLQAWAKQYPVVTLTGPRQSGKTTLARAAFPGYGYCNLELPSEREWARTDPESFLDRFAGGVVLDEIQRVPELLSHVQVRVDAERGARGRYILTGRHNLRLMRGVSQSLAGRTALGTLLPFSLAEAYGKRPPEDPMEAIWRGFFPRVVADGLDPAEAMEFYAATYVERDVRELLNVKDLSKFSAFLRLCAGRTGQLLNAADLAADAGIAGKTALEWLSLLEASYIVRRLPPWFSNASKRLAKTPKLYFTDTGLACALLGIRSPAQLWTHPLRGAIFETYAVGELWKRECHRGGTGGLFHYRDGRKREIDLVEESVGGLALAEIKSGKTPSSEWAAALRTLSALIPNVRTLRVIYGGNTLQKRGDVTFIPWNRIEMAWDTIGQNAVPQASKTFASGALPDIVAKSAHARKERNDGYHA